VGEHGVYAGLRILELGWGAAGSATTRYFAEQGATVVRVESSERPDPLRVLHARPGEPIDLDAAPAFALLNPDKWSIALNLHEPEGVALALRLADWADVVAQSAEPGAMEDLGLGADALLARKPGLVIVTSSLFGTTGPQRDPPGAGGLAAALAGFDHLTGWPDREAVRPCAVITDSLAPRYAAVAIAAALLERGHTGLGCHIDVSQVEAGVYSLSEAVVRASANGESIVRGGNRQAGAAPHGVYPCAGNDAWIAITVFDDAEWQALVAAMDSPAWARDARFVGALGREANQGEIDAELAKWTRRTPAYALLARLQEAGIQAGVVQRFHELVRDPQLAHRRHFVTLDHAALGPLPYDRSGFRLSASPGGFDDSGPLLGEDTDVVLGEILGLSEADIARLVAEGVVEESEEEGS
jgi:benzylsuccinate CoA-transferase BbsF subunit